MPRDCIPWLECGNEVEGSWRTGGEYGRYMALLSGPVRRGWPEARFRMAEVASWNRVGDFTGKLDWLRASIVDGVEPEVARWGEIQQDSYLDAIGSRLGRDRHPDWINTCELAGFSWPPVPDGDQRWVPTDPTELVHQLGFHWYHQDQNAGDGYQGEDQLQSDAEEMKALVSDINIQRGYTLTWSVSEVGFQAVNNPDGFPEDSVDGEKNPQPYNEQASPEFQAGELLRRLLLLRSMNDGPQVACWHTFMSGIRSRSQAGEWTLFTAHGLRKDVKGRKLSFERDADAWRRPSWFAFRRLVWLLGQTSSAELLHNHNDVTLVRLESSSGFLLPSDPEFSDGNYDSSTSTGLYEPRRYAYLAWLDQSARPTKRWYLDLWDANARGYRLLSMVPNVVPPTAASAVADQNGFASGESVDWHWKGWDWPTIKTMASGTGQQIGVQLKPLDDSEGRPGPICILTDAVLLSERDSGFATMVEPRDWRVEQQADWATNIHDQTAATIADAGRILAEMQARVDDISSRPWEPWVNSIDRQDQVGWLRDFYRATMELAGDLEALDRLSQEDLEPYLR